LSLTKIKFDMVFDLKKCVQNESADKFFLTKHVKACKRTLDLKKKQHTSAPRVSALSQGQNCEKMRTLVFYCPVFGLLTCWKWMWHVVFVFIYHLSLLPFYYLFLKMFKFAI